MEKKKNPYFFTIGFNSKNRNHVRAAQILNELGRGEKADYLVKAILAYEGKPCESGISVDEDILRQMVRQIVQEETEGKVEGLPAVNISKHTSLETESIVDVSEKAEKDPALAQSLSRGLAAFRRSS